MYGEPIVGLCPGQGAYRPGVLSQAWAGGDEVVREVFAAVDEAHRARTGRTVGAVVFADPAPSLEDLVAHHADELQLTIYATAVVAHRALAVRGATPDLLVGHSLGEISALVAAGVFSVADGAAIVCDRNEVLRAHAPEGGMLALRCGRDRAELLVALLAAPDLVLAVDNAEEQIVLSGPAKDLAAAAEVARALGIGAGPLGSPYGFHHPALVPAGRELTRRVAGYRRHPFAVPVHSPVLGRRYRDGDDLAALLGLQLSQPVGFRETLARLSADGARVFVELGAGEVLTKLVRGALPLASVVPTFAAPGPLSDLDAVAAHLAGVPVPRAEAPRPVMPAAPEPTPASAPDRTVALARLRELYADTLEYPVEVLTEDASLEADLGVDSLRQTELMTQIRTLFDLPAPPSGFRGTELDTLGKIADYITAARP